MMMEGLDLESLAWDTAASFLAQKQLLDVLIRSVKKNSWANPSDHLQPWVAMEKWFKTRSGSLF